MAERCAVFLMGPTATGKTEAALALADRLPVALINADSAQVYRGMDAGTAKPDPETRRRYPHALMDIRDPAEGFSAGEYARLARAAAEEAFTQGRVPLLVGGTGLYFQAFAEGLADLPASEPEVRQRLRREGEQWGWPALHARLAETDPEAAAAIHPNDAQRLLRALEVAEVTGRPLTALQREAGAVPVEYPILKCALWLPPEELHRRIQGRFSRLLEAGLVEETAALRDRGVSPDSPALRAVGYRQALAYLEGALDRAGLNTAGMAATRRLARRQRIWLRKEPGVEWYRSDQRQERPRLMERVAAFLKDHGWS